MAAVCESTSVVAVGVNCSAPLRVEQSLAALHSGANGGAPALVAYPNAGQLWDAATETWSGAASSEFPKEWVHIWADGGAELIGGCCGIGADGVRSIANALGSWHSV
jgi:homocysteine S-methyltransferase